MLKKAFGARIPILALSFVLGLNLPRSFSLLALICVVTLLVFRADLKSCSREWVIWLSMLLLGLFGIAYTIRQLQLGVWTWHGKMFSDAATFSLLPMACLSSGWLWGRRCRNPLIGTQLLIAFALGGLVYVSLGLLFSREPWWNLTEIFTSSITVPWGDSGMAAQNVRSVEQRAYAALAFVAVIPWLFWFKPMGWSAKVLACFGLCAWGGYVVWSLNSTKLMLFVVFVALLPCLHMLPRRRFRLITVSLLGLLVTFLVFTKRICDERLYMQIGFIKHIQDHPWGGRQIHFPFAGCPGQPPRIFGPPRNLFTLPHNIFLDQINDVGIIPAFFLLASCAFLLVALLRGFSANANLNDWGPCLALRWGLLACILTQALFQPFLYSDRLLFCVTFLFTGTTLAEFSLRSRRFS